MVLNEKQLKEYGKRLSESLKAGAVIALYGDLGTGKTTLAQAIAAGLGVTEHVTSPTFTLINEYRSGRLPLYHFDVYRLGGAGESGPGSSDGPDAPGIPDSYQAEKELIEIGYEEYFYGGGVTIIEWADRIEKLLPENTLRIELCYTDNLDERKVTADQEPGVGAGGSACPAELQYPKAPVLSTGIEGAGFGESFEWTRSASLTEYTNRAETEIKAGRDILLAIETTGKLCSVALRTEDGRIFHRESEEGLRHLTSLVPMIESLLKEAGVQKRKLGAIAVSAGPGSFTGIRIGVSTVRALSQTLGVPAIKVPTLETFAYLAEGGAEYTVACPVFDARREQIYAGAYVLEQDGRIMTLVKGGAYDPDEYFRALAAAVTALENLMKRMSGPEAKPVCNFMGDGVDIAAPLITGAENYYMSPIVQDACMTLAWAENHGIQTGYSELEPIYIRKAEAQRRLDEKDALLKPERFLLRAADKKDVYGISVIERLSFSEPWLEKSILDDIALEYSDYVVCEDEGFIMGYAGLHRILDEGHITNIAVHPSVRQKGVGEAVLSELLQRCEPKGISSFSLEVRASDEGAICFYRKQGFEIVGRRKDYYPKYGGGREDALIMLRRSGMNDVY